LTGLSYGNGVQMSITDFNNKLQATKFEVKKNTTSYIKKEYQFYADGSLKFIDDVLDETFDRLYKYDHAGRTVEAEAGTAARGQSPTGPHNLDQPYTMAYEHDAFGHITSKTGYYYSSQDDNSYSYTNNRAPNWNYDSDGNTTSDEDAVYGFDAAGHLVKTEERELDTSGLQPPTVDSFDGDGRLVKRVRNFGSTDPAPQTNYYIHSTVLGKLVSEADETGRKLKTFVPANGVTLAQQQVIYYQGTTERLTFVHQDASTTGTQETNDDGTLVNASDRSGEYDPLGRNIASAGPYISLDTNPPGSDSGSGVNMFGSGEGYRPGQQSYRIDHLAVPASRFMEEINTGLHGGAFGLLELAARMSIPRVKGSHYTVGDERMPWTMEGAEYAVGQAIEMGLPIIQHWIVDTTWTLNFSQIGFQTTSRPEGSQTVDGPRYLKEHDVVGAKWYPKITNMLMDIFGDEDCKKAFMDAGIDLAAVWKTGFYIGSSTLITDNAVTDAQTSLPGNVRQAYRDHLKANSGLFSKVVASTVFLEGDSRPRVFLTHNAIAPGFFSSAEDTLKNVLIHELIHVGGKTGKDSGIWKYLGYDDLSYMQREYKNIVRNCQ
jgi:hypothetical protein